MTMTLPAAPTHTARADVARRFRPLQIATLLQGVALWVPIEKLFMTQLGFTAAAVAVMAAAYAAATPLLEIPSGILADRWSRRGVLMLANGAAALSALVGGLSQNVASYLLSAVILGAYFAMNSGNAEAIVYDTLVEETGSGEGFERHIGRVHLVNSIALVASAFAGGWLAAALSLRATYLLSVPFALGSVLALIWLREPRRHHAEERRPLRAQVAITYTTIVRHGGLRTLAVAIALLSALTQMVFEFGPLWLVELRAPASWYGPFTAALVSTLGIGGALAGRVNLRRPAVLAGAVGLAVASGLVLVSSWSAPLIIMAFVALALVCSVATTFLTKLLHDALPSDIRTGVASGVSTLSWLVLLPLACVFGLAVDGFGAHQGGWLLVGVAGMGVALLARAARARR